MRLTPSGLLRWYAGCCRSPIGNTLASRQVPFVGLIVRCIDPESQGRALDEVLGPIRGRGHARFATGNRAELDATDRFPARVILRLFGISLAARLRGDHRRSPFFDARTGAPIAPPRVLTAAELAAVRARGGLVREM